MLCYLYTASLVSNIVITVSLDMSHNYETFCGSTMVLLRIHGIRDMTLFCLQEEDSFLTPHPLNMKALCSFEMVGNTNPATQHHIPENTNPSCN
jgi:hypothetical protein